MSELNKIVSLINNAHESYFPQVEYRYANPGDTFVDRFTAYLNLNFKSGYYKVLYTSKSKKICEFSIRVIKYYYE